MTGRSSLPDPPTQAHGLEELRGGPALGELSEEMRILLWDAFDAMTERATISDPTTGSYAPVFVVGGWEQVVLTLARRYLHVSSGDLRYEDQLWGSRGTAADAVREAFRPFFRSDTPHIRVLDLVQDAMRHERCPTQFVSAVTDAFKECDASYFVDTSGPPTIFPVSTEQEREAITSALQGLEDAGRIRATDRLRRAGEQFREGHWGESADHSISAVESLLNSLGTGEKRFAKIFAKLQQTRGWDIHPALVSAVVKLFGWASDVADARHGGGDEARVVSREEAEFMIPVCSAICTYLLAKERAETSPENDGQGSKDG